MEKEFKYCGKKSPVMELICDGEHWICPNCEKKLKPKKEFNLSKKRKSFLSQSMGKTPTSPYYWEEKDIKEFIRICEKDLKMLRPDSTTEMIRLSDAIQVIKQRAGPKLL